MIWFLLAGALVVAVIMYLIGRRNESAVLMDWEPLLTRRHALALTSLESRVHTGLAAADLAYDRAFEEKEKGSMEEAHRLLEVGSRAIESFAPTIVRALAAMAALSRMVSAIAPIRPLRPSDFKIAQIVQLAHLNRFMHHLLASTGERFRLRLAIVGRGFRVLRHLLLASTRRPDPHWDTIQDIRHDLNQLSEESLKCFRTLLLSAGPARERPPAQ